jgi:hypothetical protein
VKPTREELQTAVEEAERLRELGEDPHFLAKSLLYLQQRNEDLEKVLAHLERYLEFGHPVDEHTRLEKLIEAAKLRELLAAGEESEEFGL